MFLLPLQPLPGAPLVQPPESSGLLDIGTGFRDMLQSAQQQLDAESASPLPDRSMLAALVADLVDDAPSDGDSSPKQIVSVLVSSDDVATPSEQSLPMFGGKALVASQIEGALPKQEEQANTFQRKIPVMPSLVMPLDEVSESQTWQIVQPASSDKTPQILVNPQNPIVTNAREEMPVVILPVAEGAQEGIVPDTQPAQDVTSATVLAQNAVRLSAEGEARVARDGQSGEPEKLDVTFQGATRQTSVSDGARPQLDFAENSADDTRGFSNPQVVASAGSEAQSTTPSIHFAQADQSEDTERDQTPEVFVQKNSSESVQTSGAFVNSSGEQTQTETDVLQKSGASALNVQSSHQPFLSQTETPVPSVVSSDEGLGEGVDRYAPNGVALSGSQSSQQPSVSQTETPVPSVISSGEGLGEGVDGRTRNVVASPESQSSQQPSVSQTETPVPTVVSSGEGLGDGVDRRTRNVVASSESQSSHQPSVSQTETPVPTVGSSGEGLGDGVDGRTRNVVASSESQLSQQPSASQMGTPVAPVVSSGEGLGEDVDRRGATRQPSASQMETPVTLVGSSGEDDEGQTLGRRDASGEQARTIFAQTERQDAQKAAASEPVVQKISVVSESDLVADRAQIVTSTDDGQGGVGVQQRASGMPLERSEAAQSVTRQNVSSQSQPLLANPVINEGVSSTEGASSKPAPVANENQSQPQVLSPGLQRSDVTPHTPVQQATPMSRQNVIAQQPNTFGQNSVSAEQVGLDSDILPKLPSGFRDLEDVPQQQVITSSNTVTQPQGGLGASENVKSDQVGALKQPVTSAQVVQPQALENQAETQVRVSQSGDAPVVYPVPQESQITRVALAQQPQQPVQQDGAIENGAPAVVRDAAVVSQVIASDQTVSRSVERPVQDVSTTADTAEPNVFVASESQMDNNASNRDQNRSSRQPAVAPTVAPEQPVTFDEVVEPEVLVPNGDSSVDLETQGIERIPGRPEMRVDTMPRAGATTDIPDRQLDAMPSEEIDRNYRVSEQVIRSARVLTRGGASEVTMRLDPQELGAVTVRLSSEGQVVSGEIVVENQKVQEIVQRNLGALREALAGQGIQIENIDVSVNDRGAQADRETFRDNLEDRSEERESREQARSDLRREQQSRQQKQTPDGQVDYMA